MPCDIFLYATVFCDYFDSVFAVGITRDGQQLAVFRHTLVFLNDMSGNFQQTNVTFCTRFLAFGLNPQITIKRDLFGCLPAQWDFCRIICPIRHSTILPLHPACNWIGILCRSRSHGTWPAQARSSLGHCAWDKIRLWMLISYSTFLSDKIITCRVVSWCAKRCQSV